MTRYPGRAGFTLYEALMVLIIVGVVVAALMPSVSRQVTRARINRGAYVVAADFLMAQSQASRQHAPVRISFDVTTKQITLSDASTGTVLQTRRLGADSEFKIPTMTASQTAIVVLPNGTTSQSVLITLAGPSLTRNVSCSRAGQVRTW